MSTYVALTELFVNRVESATVRRLLLAGADAFWRDGFHASSTREIARRAKLSPAAVYVHFKAKEDLLFTIIQAVSENLRDRLVELASEGGTPTELLCRLVQAYVAIPARMYKASLVANREFGSLTPSQRRKIVKIRDELEQIVGNCLAAGNASGEFSFEDLSITRMAVLSLCRSTLFWYSPRGRFTPEQVADKHVQLVLGMVGSQRSEGNVATPVLRRATG